MKKILVVLILLAFASAGWFYFNRVHGDLSASHAQEQYQCPMHPQVVQDHPGNCPICGMRLNHLASEPSAQPAEGQKKIAFYRNPMNPKVTSPVPAKDEMGMDYIPVYQQTGDALPASDVPDHGAVMLSADKIQTIGIRTAEARISNLILSLRVTGTVFHNHEIYEMLTAYRDAIQVEQRVKKPTPELVAQSRVKANDLRIKLRRYGIGDEVFKKAAENLADPTSFIPAHLIIAANGAYVDARLPAAEAVRVALGQKARLMSSLFPDKTLDGIVKSVDSIVDSETQTVAVRIEVQNGHELLRPGLFVNVEMDIETGNKLAVPEDAILNSGRGAYVFIEKSAGVFLPKHVETGLTAGTNVEIISGLAEGEKVVISANFLLDSESRFEAARQGGSYD